MPSYSLVEIRSELTMRRNDALSAVAPKATSMSIGWAKVASEIAHIEPGAEMDIDILKILSDVARPGRR